MTGHDELEKLRARIDEFDERIQDLINQRVAVAQAIAKVKRQQGAASFYRPEREAQLLRRVIERNDGPLSDHEMARLFREIMSATLAAEMPINIAFLGPEGTYTQAAALKHFGHAIQTSPMNTVDDVFRMVEADKAHYGVVPIENSVEGVVTHTLDNFIDSPLQICGEVVLRIRHQFLSKESRVADVRRILGHGQAVAQCRGWIAANAPTCTVELVSSNAQAAKLAAEQPQTAAIASSSAGEIYGLPLLAGDIEDDPGNTTRFLIVGNTETPPSGRDKTSLLVSSKNRPGALYHLLAVFAEYDISMTRIESRPSRQALWEYVFFIDIEGHREDPAVARALHKLDDEAAFLKLLGAYPRAVL